LYPHFLANREFDHGDPVAIDHIRLSILIID